jgi:ABC-2 type transport system permease protein
MSRTIRAIIAVVFVLVITFSAISISQNVGRRWKVDVTGQKLYTLSAGTRSILAKLNQPIKLKLYYARTAAMKGPDQIKYFNNYYEFVKSLLEEYVAAAKGMVSLEIIDPRPFSNDEVDATRYGLKKFPITEEENFFFGLVAQTQFGVEKSISFFAPDRQSFVEYDISCLIDTAITRQKKTIGLLSSLPMMGEASDYMARMMIMQGQQPKTPWTIVQHLRQQYEVKGIPADTNDINNIDVLLVIHPKNLPEQTLFAIDQFVLKGGRTIICVDPYCYADQQNPMASQFGAISPSSNLKRLLNTWGLDMPEMTFAGDRQLSPMATLGNSQRAEKIIGYLELAPPQCFNRDNVITAQLNNVRVWFAGVLNEVASSNDVNEQGQIERTPLIMTTAKGNSFKVGSPFELQALDASMLMQNFVDGTKPAVMGYFVTGRFKSSFPDGIEVQADSEPKDANGPAKPKVRVTGLTEAAENCAVVVFADVDFISDAMAYYRNPLFGTIIVGDNSALLMNVIDDLGGSSDLISIRSRGGLRRPFTVIDDIEAKAELETAGEVANLNAEIEGFENELRTLVTSTNEKEKQVIGSSIVQKTKDLELKKLKARQQLREVKMQRRQRIEHLGNVLRGFNMLAAPVVILVIAVALGIRRSVMKRHYISHASDS